jgi:hypothetical protein
MYILTKKQSIKNMNIDLLKSGSILYRVGERFAYNLWPKSIFPGADASMNLQLAVMLLGVSFVWTVLVKMFVGGEEDDMEYDYAGEGEGDDEDDVVSPLEAMLGSIASFVGAATKKAAPKKPAAANKAAVNKGATVAKKAYKIPFIQRLIWNTIFFYVLALIVLQIASLQLNDAKYLTFASISGPSAYFSGRRRYVPYQPRYTSY